MAVGRVSKTSVDRLAAGLKDAFLWDDKLTGFGVKITPSGRKIYLYQYRLGGRGAPVRRFTIGKHGTLTPDLARKEAERLVLLTTQGVDPQSQKVKRARQAIDLSFDTYAERFVENCLKHKWKASHSAASAHLRRYVIPVLSKRALPDIDRTDIRTVMTAVREQ